MIYCPRGRAASEGFISHNARLGGLYLTYFIIEVFLYDFLVFYYFEFEIIEFFTSFFYLISIQGCM